MFILFCFWWGDEIIHADDGGFFAHKFDAAPKNVEKQKRGTDGLRHFSEVRWWWLLPGRYITSRR